MAPRIRRNKARVQEDIIPTSTPRHQIIIATMSGPQTSSFIHIDTSGGDNHGRGNNNFDYVEAYASGPSYEIGMGVSEYGDIPGSAENMQDRERDAGINIVKSKRYINSVCDFCWLAFC